MNYYTIIFVNIWSKTVQFLNSVMFSMAIFFPLKHLSFKWFFALFVFTVNMFRRHRNNEKRKHPNFIPHVFSKVSVFKR